MPRPSTPPVNRMVQLPYYAKPLLGTLAAQSGERKCVVLHAGLMALSELSAADRVVYLNEARVDLNNAIAGAADSTAGTPE